MRQLMLVMLLATPGQGADTPAAEFTRLKRLGAKVTIAAKEKPLRTVLDGISDQLEARKFGRLRFDIAPIAMALIPAAVTVEVKDLPLNEALGKTLNPAGLTFTVVSSEIDPKDGWIRITKGEKPAEVVKGPAATAEEEKDAKLKFDAAKTAIAGGKPEDAKFLLKFIVKKYPTASMAAEAKTLLESLK